MNVAAHSKKTRIPWRRIIPIAVVVLVLGYNYSRPTLERWIGRPLPALNNDNNGRNTSNVPRAGNSSGGDYTATLPGQKATKSNGSGSNSGGFEMKEVGRNRFESPAGLLYTMGGGGEHRIDHVMRHATDMPSRPSHGVFIGDGDRDTVLQLVDDAYELAKAKSPKAKHEESRGNDLWNVSMGRKVGFDGGQKGKRNGNKSLNSIRMILDGNRVITAFPVR